MLKTPDSRKTLKKTNELLKNPYIGFTSFQHFRDEPLFSDCATTDGWMKEHYPVYDFVGQDGRECGFYPDTEIAYIRLLWKDFEKTEGDFDFSLTDDIFKKAAEKNQTVMLRLMPHTTRENEDVPDFLKCRIDCPPRPASARVKDSPKDPLFIETFARAVRALGERYDGTDHFYAMDISLTGAWGEGHGYETYPEETLKMLVDTYTDSFRKTHLLGQICAPSLIQYANKTHPVGFRADGLGHDYHMDVYFPKNIFEMRDVWQHAPVSFESYWYLNEWEKQGWDVDEIIEQTLKWHISSLNAKSSPIPFVWKNKIEAWLKKMGYRYAVRLVEYPAAVSPSDTMLLTLYIENTGVAPIYTDVGFTLQLSGEKGSFSFDTGIDVRSLLPGDTIVQPTIPLPAHIPAGVYALSCRMGGGRYPLVKLAMDTPHSKDGFYYLADITVEK